MELPDLPFDPSVPDSVRLKLLRAYEHVDALIDLRENFFTTNPYAVRRVIIDAGSEGKGTQHVFFFEKYTVPWPEFGLVIGDAIHNLRSALDHLVVHLAIRGATAKGKTMSPKEVGNLQFPICLNSPDDFESQVGRDRLLNVAEDGIAFIKRSYAEILCPAS